VSEVVTLTTDPALTAVRIDAPSMGGRLRIRVDCRHAERDRAERDLRLLATRIERWAARLSRFEPTSELCGLNADPDAPETHVGPTLAGVLAWAMDAGRHTQGVVDVSLLDARIAAEQGVGPSRPMVGARWGLRRSPSTRTARVVRHGHVRFDIDGVAKGWIADRALGSLRRYPAALVDADGDIAVTIGERTGWTIGVADPSHPSDDLVAIAPARVGPRTLGIATSGIDVHRWGDGMDRHHLIDPSTGRPAASDLRQCTVIARSAALAEAVAKAMVIRGSASGMVLLDQPDVLGAVLVLRSGEILATDEVMMWLE